MHIHYLPESCCGYSFLDLNHLAKQLCQKTGKDDHSGPNPGGGGVLGVTCTGLEPPPPPPPPPSTAIYKTCRSHSAGLEDREA